MPLIGFFLDYVIDNMFLPGQVENWVTITDMGNMGLSDLPINVSPTQQLRKLIEILQQNYRCRLAHNYVLNAPTSVTVVWAIIKKFIDRDTVERISITGKRSDPSLLQLFNPRQVEEHYGGTAPNLTQFWPPIVPEGPFEAPGQLPGALLSRHSSYPLASQPEISAISEPEKTIFEAVREQEKAERVAEDLAEMQEVVIPPSLPDVPSTKDSLCDHPPPEPTVEDKSPAFPLEMDIRTEESRPIPIEATSIEIDPPIHSSFGCFCKGADRGNSPTCALF